jgi:hypothetical protein
MLKRDRQLPLRSVCPDRVGSAVRRPPDSGAKALPASSIPEKPFKKDKKIDKNILFFNKNLYICRNKT